MTTSTNTFNTFVPSEPSWANMQRARSQTPHFAEREQGDGDDSSAGSVESNCSLAMSFPDPDNSLAKTVDSLSTQPEWKSTALGLTRHSVEPSYRIIGVGGRSNGGSMKSTVNGLDPKGHSHSHSQSEAVESRHQGGEWATLTLTFDSMKKVWDEPKKRKLLLFLIAPILVALLAFTAGLPSNRSVACRLTRNTSFLGCPASLDGSQAPGSQSMAHGAPGKGKSGNNAEVNTPILVQLQLQTFSSVVDNSQGIGRTAVEIRRTGIVMSELQSLLEVSDLAGRNELAEAIAEYRMHSFAVGRGLEGFRSRLLATLGSLSVLSNNLVNEVETAEQARSTWLASINPWGSDHQVALTERLYRDLADYNRGELEDLHSQAVGQLHALDGVNRDLHSIHSLATHGKRRKDVQLQDVLGELFTMLGGNGGKVSKYREDLALIGSVEKGYREARAQVETIVQRLEMMTLDLESASGKAGAASKMLSMGDGRSRGRWSVRMLKGMTEQLVASAHERLEIGTPSQVAQRYLERGS